MKQLKMQVWRNWQTRMVQVHMSASSCRFKSCHLHQVEYPSGYSIFYTWKKPLALAGTLPFLFAARLEGFSRKRLPLFLKVYTFWRYGILLRYAHKKRLSFGKAAF